MGVVLPEVLKELPEPCTSGIVPPEAGRVLRARYGFKQWPVLVILRDGRYLGMIEGMCDWPVFVAEARRIPARSSSRPPTVGIEVRRCEARVLGRITIHSANDGLPWIMNSRLDRVGHRLGLSEEPWLPVSGGSRPLP
jgi:hypothetical protein